MSIKGASSNAKSNRSTPEVIDEALSGATLDLVQQAAEKFGWDPILVRPLSRFGYSGARILVIKRRSRIYKPYALKIANRKQVDREMGAISACQHDIRRMPPSTRFDSAVEEHGTHWSAIAYEYFEPERGQDPVDLTDIYNACMGRSDIREDSPPLEYFERRLRPLLDAALSQLDVAHQLLDRQAPRKYQEIFKWYLREKRDSRVDLVMAGSGGFSLHGVEVPRNPLEVLPNLLTHSSKGFEPVAIHGDLHLSNIVVDGATVPNLIDWAWARRGGHLFIDYALLESSMRFMRFPHDVHPGILHALDGALNREYDGGEAAQIASKVADPKTAHRMTEMVAAVRFVRRKLRQSVEDWTNECWAEYQTTLFLLLSGQQKLGSFPLMRTILNLHQLRQELGL